MADECTNASMALGLLARAVALLTSISERLESIEAVLERLAVDPQTMAEVMSEADRIMKSRDREPGEVLTMVRDAETKPVDVDPNRSP